MRSRLSNLFSDQYVTRFAYDMLNRKIEVYFERYYDLRANQLYDGKVIFTIENWTTAKSTIDDIEFETLEKNLGIFEMILDLKKADNINEIYANTLEGKYIKIIFEYATIHVKQIKENIIHNY